MPKISNISKVSSLIPAETAQKISKQGKIVAIDVCRNLPLDKDRSSSTVIYGSFSNPWTGINYVSMLPAERAEKIGQK